MICIVGLLGGATAAPAIARQVSPPPLSVETTAEGALLRWEADDEVLLAGVTPPAPQSLALLLPPDADPSPQLRHLQQIPWADGMPAPDQLPPALLPDGSSRPPLPGFGPPPMAAAPLSLLRETRLRGRRIGLYLVSPLYLRDGSPALATRFEALVPGALPLDTPIALAAFEPDAPFLITAPPPNPIAARAAWKISVSRGGIQSLSAADLKAAGLDLERVDVARLQLRRGAVPVALEELRSAETVTALRFYAPPPGDRWNAADTYWLYLANRPGLRMARRDARPKGAQPSVTAHTRGEWYTPRFYEPRLPGADGDHFFSADLRVVPPESHEEPEPATLSVTMTNELPMAAGPVVVTISGESLFSGAHRLRARIGTATREATWSSDGPWEHTLVFPAAGAQVIIELLPGDEPDGLLLDRVAWETPARLRFRERGAGFVGRLGRWAYQLNGLPAGAALYDLSNPARPERLIIGPAAFEDLAGTPRPYLLAGPRTIHKPPISAHRPTDLSKPLNARAVYIAPDDLLAALQPLLNLRRDQGYPTVAVSTEAIYDTWSGGQMSPQAIRDFLRYAAATWQTKPVAVTLVGDGSIDPRNYLGLGQRTWLPPYLERVDPWLGEAACENCYAQLDGESPLDDLMPDLMIGRLPAKSQAELAALVQKIVAYEQDRSVGPWRARMAYLADNTDFSSTGQEENNFAAAAEESIALQPDSVEITRVYYDPNAPPGNPTREADPARAFRRAMAAFDQGAAVLTFFGHGLTFQWAVTSGDPETPPYLMNVDTARDTVNGPRLPVVLSMTCLSGAFQTPLVRGTTIDEALVIHPGGGAIATWGSSGLGVLYGHESLVEGFFTKLWADPEEPPTVGALIMAGYANLGLGPNLDATESLRTFLLLGDPLTRLRALPDSEEIWLPMISR